MRKQTLISMSVWSKAWLVFSLFAYTSTIKRPLLCNLKTRNSNFSNSFSSSEAWEFQSEVAEWCSFWHEGSPGLLMATFFLGLFMGEVGLGQVPRERQRGRGLMRENVTLLDMWLWLHVKYYIFFFFLLVKTEYKSLGKCTKTTHFGSQIWR